MTTQTKQPTALITGASRGLGLALARQLAQRGWQLIVDARDAATLKKVQAELAQHTQVTAIAGDVTDEAHRRALHVAARAAGGLDVLVNNAGVLGPSPQPHLLDYPLAMLESVYRANTIAPLGVIQAVRPALKPEARLFNITSDAGIEAYPGWGGYGSSKAALEHLSAILAAENPTWRVYWVDPGDMRTEMHQAAFPGEDISDRPLPDDSVPGLLALLEGDYPSGRYQARHLPPTDKAANAVHELRVALTVADFDAAVTLYHDQLGLPVVQEWSDLKGRGILLGAGRATLELLDPAQAEQVDQVEVGKRVTGPIRLAFEVSNLAQASANLQASSASLVNGPVQTPWGDFNQRLQTADGLQLTLFQLPADA
ncbi:MAG: SDR family NAD(P)-dependent oxidoreductase [Anaerolineae bacterium]|nr:SDR family NAD(P)-dependent oxidoreductase [Anaerolineae bacterium]